MSGHYGPSGRGRQRVVDVFGDGCPVCGHSVKYHHDVAGRCRICSSADNHSCADRPWPPASCQRFTEAQWAADVRTDLAADIAVGSTNAALGMLLCGDYDGFNRFHSHAGWRLAAWLSAAAHEFDYYGGAD